MPKKCVSAPRPATASEDAKDLSSCYDLISMLEHQLRTARALLDELAQRRSPPSRTSTSVVVGRCAELRAEAVEVLIATEMLQDEVCGPANSMSTMHAREDVSAMVERIAGFWAQLPGTRPDSKLHKALLAKINVESAAYLKIADAARGIDRKAAARAEVPVR